MPEEMSEEQRMEEIKKQCPFCQIVAGNIPATKVYEDDKVIAILDINPAAKGHVLLMPKDHYFIAAMMPPDLFNYFFRMVKEVGECVEQAMLSQGVEIFLASGQSAGQQSSHMMIHIVPREQGDGLSCFDLPHNELDQKKVDELKRVLAQNLNIAIKKRAGPPKKVGRKEVLQIIEANPQVKQLMLEKPEEFKKMIPQNPQLQTLFSEVDVDEIIAELKGEKKETKKEGKKEEEKEKKGPEKGQGDAERRGEEETQEEEKQEKEQRHEEAEEEKGGEEQGEERDEEEDSGEGEKEDKEQKDDVDLDLVSRMFE